MKSLSGKDNYWSMSPRWHTVNSRLPVCPWMGRMLALPSVSQQECCRLDRSIVKL